MDFARLPMRHEAPDLIRQVDRFLERGFSVEEVFVDLLAPAARHLGDLWSRDECDFIDVTMGLWRLQEVLREISLRVPSGPSSIGRPIGHPIGQARSAVFCPVPGDVHTFGAQMIEEVFARAGWQSEALLRPHRRELLDYMASRPVDAIGLTVSHNHSVSVLARLIKAIRSVAVKPNLVVLVGGHMINCNPALVAEIGADGTGEDAKAALAIAARLVDAAQTRARAIA
ncbi:MAG: cobalamin B12-binding domain-containing protein [Erythrobacter sp.]|uniref:cobalamin B12-binding domain-containing protein n=1 Tax=Erythrobacter sp. TaxID=1042 RepID=UPI0026333B8C|nr:cobalamin B12-binding domain-containing protein [Erythrobacter sp.]MDJ0979609.1 cobalamin B12-binding domain-containing protein [Erythrobacter sp.]